MREEPITFGAAFWSVALLLLILIGCVIVLASVPPVDRDALTHHLAVPKLYLRYGGVVEIPWIEFSYYPENLDLLYMIPLYFGNDIAPKYIHFTFALLTAWLIYDFLRKRISPLYGLLGALVFLSIPVIVKLSATVYVDLGLIFFSTAALLGLLRWADKGFRRRDLILAGACCGLALGTKYNGLVTLLCLAPIAIWLHLRSGVRSVADQLRAVGAGVAFVAVALLVFSPWAIRNTVWTGNPVYPLYKGIFGPSVATVQTAAEADNSETATPAANRKPLGHFAFRKLVYGESGLEILAIPLRVFFDGEDDNPRYFDGKLNPALLYLPIVAILGWRLLPAERRQEEQALLLFSLLFLLTVFAQIDMRVRWIAPIIPPLVLLSIFGLRRIEFWLRKTPVGSVRMVAVGAYSIALLVLLGLNARYLVRLFEVISPVAYISGAESRSEYITRYRREYPVLEFANNALPPNARILGLYLGNRTYFSDRILDCRYGVFYDALKVVESPGDLVRVLSGKGFTHLLIRLDMFADNANSSLSDRERGVISELFQKNLRLLFGAGGYALFALDDS